MKGVFIPNLGANQRKPHFSKIFNTYFLIPFGTGLFGFAIFFTALLFVKTFLFLISNQNSFVVNVGDVSLSMIGFASFYIVRLFKNFRIGR